MNHPNPNLDFDALLNRDPIAIFPVLKLSKQVYAEVDVGFVSQFFGQLPKKWHWVELYQLILQKEQHKWTIYY
ncbi:hypothetical protein QL285_045395 [Trifolium repens]|nr:hypothetical protein QL285_045395 [Trifolium repens]